MFPILQCYCFSPRFALWCVNRSGGYAHCPMAGWKVLVRAVKVQPQKQKGQPETKPKALPVAQSATEPSLHSGRETPCSLMQCPSTAMQGERTGWWVCFQPFSFQQFKLTFFPFLFWIFQPFLKSCRVWTYSWPSYTSECSNSDNFPAASPSLATASKRL